MDYAKFLLTVALPLLAIAGSATAYFGKSRGDQIIKYQADEIELRNGTIARLEKDNAALTSENALLKEQNTKLGDLAQGSPQLKTLTRAVQALTEVINTKLKPEATK